MISEYHVNKILQKLDEIIEHQEAILKALERVCHKEAVECSAPVVLIPTEEPKPEPEKRPKFELSDLAELPKVKSTAAYKQAYALYKSSGGMLKWNQWLKAGRPAFASLKG